MSKRLVILAAFFVALQPCGPLRAAETNRLALLEGTQRMDSLDDHQKLGPGDKITYRVIEDQDEPRSLTVTDSGDLEVPYYGLVHAEGKTSHQLAKEIKGLLEEKLYVRATVIIALEVANKTRVTGKVYVTGRVRNPGGYDIPAGQNFTVSKAILSAGGFSDFSDKKKVRLVRKTKTGEKTFVINVADIWKNGDLTKDRTIEPDDLIVVPESLINY